MKYTFCSIVYDITMSDISLKCLQNAKEFMIFFMSDEVVNL